MSSTISLSIRGNFVVHDTLQVLNQYRKKIQYAVAVNITPSIYTEERPSPKISFQSNQPRSNKVTLFYSPPGISLHCCGPISNRQAVCSVIFIMYVLGDLFQILHMRAKNSIFSLEFIRLSNVSTCNIHFDFARDFSF